MCPNLNISTRNFKLKLATSTHVVYSKMIENYTLLMMKKETHLTILNFSSEQKWQHKTCCRCILVIKNREQSYQKWEFLSWQLYTKTKRISENDNRIHNEAENWTKKYTGSQSTSEPEFWTSNTVKNLKQWHRVS